MITQEELENLGFIYQGTFDGVPRYLYQIDRKGLYPSDTYSQYFFEIDETKDDIHRLYGRVIRGMDYNQPTYEVKTTYNDIDEVEADLIKYLRKDTKKGL